jgi:hypothetical protein
MPIAVNSTGAPSIVFASVNPELLGEEVARAGTASEALELEDAACFWQLDSNSTATIIRHTFMVHFSFFMRNKSYSFIAENPRTPADRWELRENGCGQLQSIGKWIWSSRSLASRLLLA